MGTRSVLLACDGCGLPASSEHIAERVRRLELATRFRPVHINTLFVALAPAASTEDDFYGPPESKDFFHSLMQAAGVTASADNFSSGTGQYAKDAANLAEFQRAGCYLAYLSECPIPEQSDNIHAIISTLGSTVIRRIQFNYKPKRIALLGDMEPMIAILEKAGLGPILILDHGRPLKLPKQEAVDAKHDSQLPSEV